MKEDNTPTVTARRRHPSAKMRLRLETARKLTKYYKRNAAIRKRKAEEKENAKKPDPATHVLTSRVPRLKKNKLAEPPKATSKFKRRQISKSWLPTHLWHAKRAKMTKTREPLWRMTIPPSPTEKSYRPTNRSSSKRGCVAWDMSYMASIGATGREEQLMNMLKAIGYLKGDEKGGLYKKWLRGTRCMEGWLFERDGEKRLIAPATIIWESEEMKEGVQQTNDKAPLQELTEAECYKQKKPPKRSLIVRVHPSAFLQVWTELMKAAKTQNPQVMLEDLRFEIGSVQISGPGSTEALLGVLKPIAERNGSTSETWPKLAGLTNPASLPANAILFFNILDPRFNHPPNQIRVPKDEAHYEALTELQVSWPPDGTRTSSSLFSHISRRNAVKAMPSQKAVNRRRSTAGPGGTITSKENDPQIPIMLVASRSASPSSDSLHSCDSQGSWTLLAPWRCIDPIWRSLMYYPLTSGGIPRFGGLDQIRQVAFENSAPWFPGDFPGTEAGKAWWRTEDEKALNAWKRRPPSRRANWDKVEIRGEDGRKGELGRGWMCDWEYLFNVSGREKEIMETSQARKPSSNPAAEKPKRVRTSQQRKRLKELEALKQAGAQGKEEQILPSSDNLKPVQAQVLPGSAEAINESPSNDIHMPDATASVAPAQALITTFDPAAAVQSTVNQRKELAYTNLTPTAAKHLLSTYLAAPLSSSTPQPPSLLTIHLTYLTRGTPCPNARIYRLPPSSPLPSLPSSTLRTQWLALLPPSYLNHAHPLQALRQSKSNHWGVPPTHSAHPLRPDLTRLDAIHELGIPADTTAHEETVIRSAYAKEVREREARIAKKENAQKDLVRELMGAGHVNVSERDSDDATYPACPVAADLIGYVTSGGYNLRSGRGAGTGALWGERVVEGWRREREEYEGYRNGQDERSERVRETERHLVVVRNSGERVGRLAVWEVCA